MARLTLNPDAPPPYRLKPLALGKDLQALNYLCISSNGRWLTGVETGESGGHTIVMADLENPDAAAWRWRLQDMEPGAEEAGAIYFPLASDDGELIAFINTPGRGYPLRLNEVGDLRVIRTADSRRTGQGAKAMAHRFLWLRDGSGLVHSDHNNRQVFTRLASYDGSRFRERRSGLMARSADGALMALAAPGKLLIRAMPGEEGGSDPAISLPLQLPGTVTALCFGETANLSGEIWLALADGFSSTSLHRARFDLESGHLDLGKPLAMGQEITHLWMESGVFSKIDKI